jgi:hypothetical protein
VPHPRPHARCAICADLAPCREADSATNDFPECFRPLVGTPVESAREVLEWLSEHEGASDERLRRLEEAVLHRFEKDRFDFSGVFEPSFSRDGSGWHLYRFSYAFPGHHDDSEAMKEAMLSFAAPFGARQVEWTRRMLNFTSDHCVEQPMFGIAWDSPVHWRMKLYLQFFDGVGDRPLHLAEKMLRAPELAARFSGQSLHLVGMDFTASGLAAVKLYFTNHHVDLAEDEELVGEIPLLEQLREQGHDSIEDLLTIHRLAALEDPAVEKVREVDFSLVDNDISWSEITELPALSYAREADGPLKDMFSSFPLAVVRLSVAVGHKRKLNAYYVPTTVEEE